MTELLPLAGEFRVRHDDFSVQVICEQDPMFWFRLEEDEDQDLVTDFSLGEFDPALGGDLLTMCYRVIGRRPRNRVVFTDVPAAGLAPATPAALGCGAIEAYAKAMIAQYGCAVRAAYVVRRSDKLDLAIESNLPASLD